MPGNRLDILRMLLQYGKTFEFVILISYGQHTPNKPYLPKPTCFYPVNKSLDIVRLNSMQLIYTRSRDPQVERHIPILHPPRHLHIQVSISLHFHQTRLLQGQVDEKVSNATHGWSEYVVL